jgi:hypothetical protein
VTLRESINLLVDSFPTKGVTPQTRAAYESNLNDMPESLICAAITHLVRTATFLPTIGEIRMLIAESCCGLPSDEDAWKQVRTALGNPIGADDPWAAVHPLVLECVKLLGTYDLRHDESREGKAQQHFRRAYRERRDITVKDMAAGTLPMPMPSGVVSFSSVPQLQAVNEAAS